MEHRLLFPAANPFRIIATAAVVWIVIGVPVAAVVAACRVFVWVIVSLPEMIGTAAVLGAVQGLWLYLAARPSEPNSGNNRWLGTVSGVLLGLLGFPPVFSRVNGIVVDRPMVSVFLMAALLGGITAGIASNGVVTRLLAGRTSSPGRSVVVGCLLVLPLAGLDYRLYWAETADRLPVPRVSEQAITNFLPGNARGSAWTGCYQYLGKLSRGSGVVGKEGGLLKMTQADGALKIQDIDAHPFLGTVDGNGRFRFGGERSTGQDTLRELWEGNFHGSALLFRRRLTVLQGSKVLNTTQLTGTAQRISCDR